MPDSLFVIAFTAWGSPTTWIEIVAFGLSLVMVACNIREIHWGWPLAALASVLYFALFWRSKLYGEATLQILFAIMAVWGWAQWLRGKRADGSALRVQRLSPRGWRCLLASAAVLWPVTALFLQRFTDTDVPWWDAFPTALSLIGQVLLGRKHLENWLVWIAVNVVSMGLFAWKSLWLTSLLYALFVGLSVVGWRAWQRSLRTAP